MRIDDGNLFVQSGEWKATGARLYGRSWVWWSGAFPLVRFQVIKTLTPDDGQSPRKVRNEATSTSVLRTYSAYAFSADGDAAR